MVESMSMHGATAKGFKLNRPKGHQVDVLRTPNEIQICASEYFPNGCAFANYFEYPDRNSSVYYKTHNPNVKNEEGLYRPSGDYCSISQKIEDFEGGTKKTTEVTDSIYINKTKSVQTQLADGTYSRIVSKNGEVIDELSYEMRPATRKFLTEGVGAKIEKLAFKIGQDANGCERPVLRRVASLMLDVAKKFR